MGTVQTPPVTSLSSLSLQGTPKTSREIRNVNLSSACPKSWLKDMECPFIYYAVFPVDYELLKTPSPDRGREWLGLAGTFRGHPVHSPAQSGTPQIGVPEPLPWFWSTDFQCLLSFSGDPARWVNCKTTKSKKQLQENSN